MFLATGVPLEDLRCIGGSLYVSGKLPTYPYPKPILTLTSHLGQNVGKGEGRWAKGREG